jgi:hypothetical protein
VIQIDGGGVKTDGWLRAVSCAVVLCGAAATQATPVFAAADCAALARQPTWAECAAEFSFGGTSVSAAFDGPLPLQFDDDGAAVASLDMTTLAVEPSASPQRSTAAPSTVAAIPEPHTNLLMLAGLAAIGFMATRRRRP